jgi:hypothetical protein
MRTCKAHRGKAVASVHINDEVGGMYVVDHLSAQGALLIGSRAEKEGNRITIYLHRIGHPSLLVQADVIYCEPFSSGEYSMVVSFCYESSRTETVLDKMALFGVRHAFAA